MIESLALVLVKTLVSFMFEQHLESMASIQIDGAPKWYQQQTNNNICESSYAHGKLDSIERAKLDAISQLIKRINYSTKSVANEYYKSITDSTERELVKRFSEDNKLTTFVQSAASFENIEYQEERNTTYVRACISKESMANYQSNRTREISHELTGHRYRAASKKLDQLMSNYPEPPTQQ